MFGLELLLPLLLGVGLLGLLGGADTGSSDDDDKISIDLGTAGDDVQKLSGDANTFDALGGNDTVSGGVGDDTVGGGSGKDRVSGGSGDDTVEGDGGNDRVAGDSGNDLLRGDGGKDDLIGGSGRDVLIGGKGRDDLRGNSGKDNFVFSKGDGKDVIRDFKHGQDKIQIAGAKFKQLDISKKGKDVLIEWKNVDIIVKTDKVKKFKKNDFKFGKKVGKELPEEEFTFGDGDWMV